MSNFYSPNYEIVFNISGYRYNDVIYYVVYRMPMSFTSSYSRLSIMLPAATIYEIKKMIGQLNYPHINIEIYSPRGKDESDVALVAYKPYRIINIFSEYNMETRNHHALLQLVNPILYKLSTTHLFDKRFDDKTGKEILDEYHDFLKENYGDYFNIKYICDKNDFLSHKYAESLFYDQADISIPHDIINYKCPTKFYPVCFFDDFYFPKSSQNKMINLFYIDYANLDEHEEGDELQNQLFNIISSKSVRIIPIGDETKQLDKLKDFTSRTYIDSENMVCVYDRREKGKRFDVDQNSSNVQLSKKISVVNDESYVKGQTSIEQSCYEINASYPDTLENLAQRFNSCYNFFKEGPNNIHYFKTHYCLMNFVHFGYKYALDVDFPEDYRFVPFNVVHVFERQYKDVLNRLETKNLKPVWCKHFCNALFFEYETES